MIFGNSFLFLRQTTFATTSLGSFFICYNHEDINLKKFFISIT
ncbi:hypothetical protein CU004_2645 [Enterococcus faecium]|nr:hypothetical protein [Enterococcus faecium]MBK4870764.1 hypothetical protein [Enterococcus faecium]